MCGACCACKACCACPGWAWGSACSWDAGGMLEWKGRVRCAPRVACVADGVKKIIAGAGHVGRGLNASRDLQGDAGGAFAKRWCDAGRVPAAGGAGPGCWRWAVERCRRASPGLRVRRPRAVSVHTCTSVCVHVSARAGVHHGPRCRAGPCSRCLWTRVLLWLQMHPMPRQRWEVLLIILIGF